MPRQGLDAASGVVLARTAAGEGDLLLTLFLKGRGLIRASARGAASGRVRFGGGTEPLVWGSFRLHRGRGGGVYLNAVDVIDGMIPLRRRPEALRAAVRWAKLLTRHLMAEHPADDLLANLYWNMRPKSSLNFAASRSCQSPTAFSLPLKKRRILSYISGCMKRYG